MWFHDWHNGQPIREAKQEEQFPTQFQQWVHVHSRFTFNAICILGQDLTVTGLGSRALSLQSMQDTAFFVILHLSLPGPCPLLQDASGPKVLVCTAGADAISGFSLSSCVVIKATQQSGPAQSAWPSCSPDVEWPPSVAWWEICTHWFPDQEGDCGVSLSHMFQVSLCPRDTHYLLVPVSVKIQPLFCLWGRSWVYPFFC